MNTLLFAFAAIPVVLVLGVVWFRRSERAAHRRALREVGW
jgi:hypothetical protein